MTTSIVETSNNFWEEYQKKAGLKLKKQQQMLKSRVKRELKKYDNLKVLSLQIMDNDVIPAVKGVIIITNKFNVKELIKFTLTYYDNLKCTDLNYTYFNMCNYRRIKKHALITFDNVKSSISYMYYNLHKYQQVETIYY